MSIESPTDDPPSRTIAIQRSSGSALLTAQSARSAAGPSSRTVPLETPRPSAPWQEPHQAPYSTAPVSAGAWNTIPSASTVADIVMDRSSRSRKYALAQADVARAAYGRGHEREVDVPELKLPNDEAKTLHGVLTEYLSDLRMEIANTDSFDFREDLKRTETLLKGLIAVLEGSR